DDHGVVDLQPDLVPLVGPGLALSRIRIVAQAQLDQVRVAVARDHASERIGEERGIRREAVRLDRRNVVLRASDGDFDRAENAAAWGVAAGIAADDDLVVAATENEATEGDEVADLRRWRRREAHGSRERQTRWILAAVLTRIRCVEDRERQD